ncbi:TrmH family RNA methyltransferase [Microbacterium excoecariae]|uniref:TrmH family RNA methyltransferase n=1 Tax=Microbacterium excoecariae TaxID=2715210 RepID=UPI00140E3013|nr:RNA methyltransferase [Microbacterium excoecariae]NHI16778.1 RNA methyltransferase [Microbacterium excoecariae]
MRLVPLSDPADPRLADYRDLTDVALRRVLEPEGGLYMAESAKVLGRALAAGHLPRSVMTAEKWLPDVEGLVAELDVPVYVVPDAVAESVTGYTVHRGMLAAMHRPELPDPAVVLRDARTVFVLDGLVDHTNVGCGENRGITSNTSKSSRIAILDGLVDHTNVGACFRSAAAMGVDAVLVTPTCADPLYRRSVRVSMGTVFQVPWTRIENWPASVQGLKDAGYVVAGMTLGEGAITLDQLVAEDHQNLALVFGSEGPGLAPTTQRLLDRRVTIPMMGGVDSLNVAASSAVAFYATR